MALASHAPRAHGARQARQARPLSRGSAHVGRRSQGRELRGLLLPPLCLLRLLRLDARVQREAAEQL
eukprot:5765488-Prymnesium_polylepis.1